MFRRGGYYDRTLGLPGQFCSLNMSKETVQQSNLHLNGHAPKKKSGVKQEKETQINFNEKITTLKEEFLNAQDKFLLSGNLNDKHATAIKKKAYDQELKRSRQEANATCIQQAENKSKAVWTIINSERKRKINPETIKLEILHDGELITDTGRIVNHFNKYFSTIADETLKATNINNSSSTNTQIFKQVKRSIDQADYSISDAGVALCWVLSTELHRLSTRLEVSPTETETTFSSIKLKILHLAFKGTSAYRKPRIRRTSFGSLQVDQSDLIGRATRPENSTPRGNELVGHTNPKWFRRKTIFRDKRRVWCTTATIQDSQNKMLMVLSHQGLQPLKSLRIVCLQVNR
ncbi:hypothetical protein J6590_010437 [Homalodisca vitripennis]|nr:hypothetical protein J6590_010437 [Homalodisca vitripennis]